MILKLGFTSGRRNPGKSTHDTQLDKRCDAQAGEILASLHMIRNLTKEIVMNPSLNPGQILIW